MIRERLEQMIKDGVQVSACKAFADQLGAISELEKQGIEHRYWSEPLTESIKSTD